MCQTIPRMTRETFHLTDDFTDQPAEQQLLAAMAADVELHWRIAEELTVEAFAVETIIAAKLYTTLEAESANLVQNSAECYELPVEWKPGTNPEAIAAHLRDLHQRRLVAELVERAGVGLVDDDRPAADLALELEERAAAIRGALHDADAGQLLSGADLLADVLTDAANRRRQREATGRAVMGLPTGLSTLDDCIGGLNTGLHLLAGGPGVGKTSLALQMALEVAAETPAIYVTFENSPANLLQKAIAARATPALRVSDIRRGYADPAALEEAAQRLPLEQLYLVEGNGALSVADVRAKARRATARHSASQCLVVVDYLQLWAKASRELRELGTIRERVEALGTELGELSRRLDSPVLAIVSQSRAANYGREGTGRAALDTLKESGDLEYAADVVMFLTSSDRFAQPPMQALDLTIKKNRHGPGDKVVPLVFRADHGVMHLEATEAA